MGSAELDKMLDKLIIHSHIITYGNAADEAITVFFLSEFRA